MESFVDRGEYRRILTEEFNLRPNNKFHHSFMSSAFTTPYTDIRMAMEQIHEVAVNSTVLRSYVKSYGLDQSERKEVPAKNYDGTSKSRPLAYESDGAHVNLVCEILDHALIACYGPDFGQLGGEHPCTVDGYSYRDIMKAARIHDLPENLTGDNPDNDSFDEKAKDAFEEKFFTSFTGNFPTFDATTGTKVLKLLLEMRDKSSPTGRLLYICDKFAANVITLVYDFLGAPPKKGYRGSIPLSGRDRAEMDLCDSFDENTMRHASEMWAVDMLHIRNLIQYDDTGFITACLVMYTLMVRGHWYEWRERDYLAAKSKAETRKSQS